MKNKGETRGKRKEEKMKSRKKDTQTRSMKKRKEGDRKKKEKWENGRIDESTTERMSTRTDGRMDGWMNE